MRDQLQANNRRSAGKLLAVLCLSCLGCSGDREVAADPPAPTRSQSNATAVVRGDFRQSLLLTGELASAAGEVIVVPRLPSWETTIRWMVDDGAFVAEGDRVMELDTAQIASELENKITARQQSLNQLAAKQAEIQQQFAQKRFAVERARVDRRKAEIEASVPEDVQSEKLYQEKQLAFEQVRVEHQKALADQEGYEESSAAELEVLNIDLRTTEREVREAQDAIDAMVLRAPQSGIVVAAENRREGRKYQVGDTVSVGRSVLEIPDLSRMIVNANLSDVDDGKIASGMRTVCTMDAYPGIQVLGTVVSMSPVAQERDFRSMQRHFRVLLDLDESLAEVMRPGMSVKVEIETTRREDALLAPRAALRFTDTEALLELADGELYPVTLGPCNAHQCVLEEGPDEGTLVAAR